MLRRALVNVKFWVQDREKPFEGCVLYEFRERGENCYKKLDQIFIRRHSKFLLESFIENEGSGSIKFYNGFPLSCSWVDCLLDKTMFRTWYLENGIMYIPVKKICAFSIYDTISAFVVEDGDPQAEIDKVLESQGKYGLEEIDSLKDKSQKGGDMSIFDLVTN